MALVWGHDLRPPHMCYQDKFDRSRLNRWYVGLYTEVLRKVDLHQGHLEPPRIDRLPMTSY